MKKTSSTLAGYMRLALMVLKSGVDEADSAFLESEWGTFLKESTLDYYHTYDSYYTNNSSMQLG